MTESSRLRNAAFAVAFGLVFFGNVFAEEAAVATPGAPGTMPPAGMEASSAAAGSPPSAAAAVDPSVPMKTTDYKKFRDPFKEPIVSEVADLRSDLERFAVTDFKVTGIVTGPLRMRAMIIAPDGKTHYVSEKMKIGLRDGVISRITTKTIIVREKVVNPLGEVEYFDTEIGIDQQVATGEGKR